MKILMYHSISNGPLPLCIAPQDFVAHLNALQQRKLRGISLLQYLQGDTQGTVVLTFDDGYLDNATEAAPELARRGFSATLFVAWQTLPPGQLPFPAPGPLMDWERLKELQQQGWEIGSHAASHRNLNQLAPEQAQAEIVESKLHLEERLETTIRSFAAPFGACHPGLRDWVAAHYQIAVGTRLGLVEPDSDRYDLPRLEMHYFRKASRFEQLLDGQGGLYLAWRKLGRQLRNWGTQG